MILIADSGSTKTDWRLINSSTISQFETMGLNPHFTNASFFESQINKLEMKYETIDEVYFYGAGCSSVQKKSWMKSQLESIFKNARVSIFSDLLAAAHATLDKDQGLIGILGTGSNVAYFDGKKLHQKTPSLGYILGDEGAGSYLGKLFLKSFFEDKLSKDLIKKVSLDKNSVLSNLYLSDSPNKYLASFAPLIFRNRKNPEIAQLIQENFDHFFERQVLQYEVRSISLVGSLAFNFNSELRSSAQKYNINISRILERPISSLANYYLQRINNS